MIGMLSAAAALLLIVSGLAKVAAPEPATGMLLTLLGWSATRRAARRAALQRTVRAGGVGEAAIGVAVLAVGGPVPALLLATCYLAFTVVAARLVTGGQRRTSCGCFGSADSPVGPAHLVLDVVCLAAGGAAALSTVGPLGGLLAHSGTVAAVGSLQVVVLAALGYLAVTSLPALVASSALRVEDRALTQPAHEAH